MAANLFFWRQEEQIGNFGDALSVMYMERLFGERCLFDMGSLHLVGSVITPNRLRQAKRDGYKPNDWQGRPIFWGCGKKDGEPLAPELQRGALFLGVRGTMTRDALGLPRAATPLGDTALLLPSFYSPRHDARTAGKVLWVPHFHYEDPTPEALAQTPDHCVMRPAIPNTVDACERFIDAIASAEFVMANAMHAAVVALAYGVPFAFWSGSEINHPFKWADFTSGVGFDLPFCDSFADGKALFDKVRPDRAFAEADLKPLLDVAPYQLKAAVALPKVAASKPA